MVKDLISRDFSNKTGNFLSSFVYFPSLSNFYTVKKKMFTIIVSRVWSSHISLQFCDFFCSFSSFSAQRRMYRQRVYTHPLNVYRDNLSRALRHIFLLPSVVAERKKIITQQRTRFYFSAFLSPYNTIKKKEDNNYNNSIIINFFSQWRHRKIEEKKNGGPCDDEWCIVIVVIMIVNVINRN